MFIVDQVANAVRERLAASVLRERHGQVYCPGECPHTVAVTCVADLVALSSPIISCWSGGLYRWFLGMGLL